MSFVFDWLLVRMSIPLMLGRSADAQGPIDRVHAITLNGLGNVGRGLHSAVSVHGRAGDRVRSRANVVMGFHYDIPHRSLLRACRFHALR
jgi:hypothetical protein